MIWLTKIVVFFTNNGIIAKNGKMRQNLAAVENNDKILSCSGAIFNITTS